MKCNLAVYTATEGYSWQTGTKISNNDLIEYKRIIGRFPDPTVDIIPFGGAFLCRNKVVFYRFHIAKQADSKGRDALYLVLGACDKDKARLINFMELFELPELAKVNSVLPTELNYTGNGSAAANVDFRDSFNKGFSRKEDLAMLGAILSNCPNNDLVIKIAENNNSVSFVVNYKATQAAAENSINTVDNMFKVTPKISNVQNRNSHLSSTYIPAEVQSVNNNGSNFAMFVVIALLSLVGGIIIGYFLRGALISEETVVAPKTTKSQQVIKVKEDINTVDQFQKPIEREFNNIPKQPGRVNNNVHFETVNPAEPSNVDRINTPNIQENNNTPAEPKQPNRIIEPNRQKPCTDCGIAILGCQECQTTGFYRGRICHYCNGRGRIQEIILCPRHRKELIIDNKNSRDNVTSEYIKEDGDLNKNVRGDRENKNIKLDL